jgi:hypothetical protein
MLAEITQHLQAAPVPPSERTELPIPATLEQLVLACLAKKPEDRPQNARQLAQSLDTIDGMTWARRRRIDGGASITHRRRRHPTRLRSEHGHRPRDRAGRVTDSVVTIVVMDAPP